jgi:hypothetical protein
VVVVELKSSSDATVAIRRFVMAGFVLVLILGPIPPSIAIEPDVALPEPVPCEGCWVPEMETSWQIQFAGRLNTSFDVEVYEVDMFDTSREVVSDLHADERRVVCYISAGSWERWRPDADDFPKDVLGKELDGWPGERWLDIRRLRVLKPLLRDRIELCKAKGFDSVEFDNVNGFRNRTGFALRGADQLEFNAWLANAAHENGLSAALKNDGAQAEDLVDYFDWSLVEQCFQYAECGDYDVFVDSGKPVMEIEYKLERSEFCERADAHGFNAIRKHRNLDAWRRPCT